MIVAFILFEIMRFRGTPYKLKSSTQCVNIIREFPRLNAFQFFLLIDFIPQKVFSNYYIFFFIEFNNNEINFCILLSMNIYIYLCMFY